MLRYTNEYGAQLVRDYPGRFGLMATLPLADIDGSLRELEYAFDTLKADGVGLLTSYGDALSGQSAFRSDLAGAQPAQGGGLFPPEHAGLLRRAVAGRAGPDHRVPVQHGAHGHQPALYRHLSADSRTSSTSSAIPAAH